jgi:small subunit ribosomal protein S17
MPAKKVETKEKKAAAKPAAAQVATVKAAIISKKFNGIVVSDKNNKTIIVKVESVKVHPKYKKRYTVSRRYKVHDEANKYKVGDKVVFIECRPLSRDKRWRVINQ